MTRQQQLFVTSLLTAWVGMLLACGGGADAKWKRGDKAGAAKEYKEAYDGWFVKAEQKKKLLPRIVEYEIEANNTDEAKKWINRGLDDQLDIEYTEPAQKALFAAVELDRDTAAVQKDKKDYDGWFVSSSDKEKMLRRIVEVETNAGNIDEAKKWIKRGLDDGLKVEYTHPTAKKLLAAAQKEREETRAKVEAEAARKAAENHVIPYEVLEEHRLGDGKVMLYILVSEKASKEDVMKLAKRLWQRNDIDTLRVFDARAAYDSDAWVRRNGRDDPKYPEKEFNRHHLAAGFVKSVSGDNGIRWVAEGRDH